MAGEDPKHLARLRELPCCKCGRAAPSIPHHHTGRREGLGRKSHDRDAMPLCYICHDGLHANVAGFRGWTRARLRAWQDKMADRFARLPETPR